MGELVEDVELLRQAALADDPRQPRPHLALRFGVEPRDVEVGAPEEANTYIAPASPEVAKRFVFDPRDADKRLPPVPPSLREAGGNRSWTIFSYTTQSGEGCRGAH